MALLLVATAGAAMTTDELRRRLQDPRYKVRIQAASALAKARPPGAREAIETLLRDTEPIVRAAACDALLVLGDPAAIPAIKRVAKDRSDTVRRRARLAVSVLRRRAQESTPATPAGTVLLEPSQDRSAQPLPGVAAALQRGLDQEQRAQAIALGGLQRRYLLITNVRKVVKRASRAHTTVEAECDMTVAELPDRTLRLSTTVTAAAAVTGTADQEEIVRLACDAAQGAGAELFKEFTSWALIQPSPQKERSQRRRRR